MGSDPADKLLDRALAAYSAGEPRPGLEQRVLSRLPAQPVRPRFRSLRWALAVPALAAAVLFVMFMHRAPAPPRAPNPPAPAWIAAASPERPLRDGGGPVRSPRHRAAARAPKQPVFPTPSPLTGEERILLAFAAREPEQALEAFREPPPEKIRPLEIPPLEVNHATR